MANEASDRTIRRLVGVYNADGTVLGELRYLIGARFGRGHCALCDITHGRVRSKPEWRDCRDQLTITFDTYHRDDQPDALRRICDTPPVVAAETDSGFQILIESAELAACHGSVDELIHAVKRAVDRSALVWLP